MTYITTVASAAKKDSIFVLTATELAGAVITGLDLVGWLGTSTSELSLPKDIRQITSSHTFCRREDTHDQTLLANHTESKKVRFANNVTHSQMPATGTATSVSRELGDIALHASTKDSTAHILFFQSVAKAPTPSKLQAQQSTCHICLKTDMYRCR
jgi:hypothetical protein